MKKEVKDYLDELDAAALVELYETIKYCREEGQLPEERELYKAVWANLANFGYESNRAAEDVILFYMAGEYTNAVKLLICKS